MPYAPDNRKPVLSRCLCAAHHAAAAYSGVVTVGDYIKVYFFAAGESAGYVAFAPGYVVISIRGTDSRADWKTNLDRKPVAWKLSAGRVHAGFLSASTAVAERVVGLLNAEHVRSSTPLYITGHSQGGAIAALLSVILADRGWHIAETITFASPRCMDGTAAAAVDTCHLIRVVNDGDAIPFLPLHLFGSGYSHAGRLLYLDRNGVVDTEPTSLPGRLFARARSGSAALRLLLPGASGVAVALRSVRAHSMDEHVRRLKLAGAEE